MFVAGSGIDGLAPARQAGLEPLGLVYGVVNRVSASGGVNVIGEQKRTAQAHLEALHLALQRMNEQAQKLGANGIVGVAIEASAQAAQGSEFMQLIECRASGAAVREREVFAETPLWAATLSAQELWTLRQAGYWPKGIVAGYGSVFANGDRWLARRMMAGQSSRVGPGNIELTWMAEALQQARRLAVAGIEADAKQAGAAGIVGLTLDKRVHLAGPNVLRVDLQAVGTAIAPLRRAPERQAPPIVMNMAEPRRADVPMAELQHKAPYHRRQARPLADSFTAEQRDGERSQ